MSLIETTAPISIENLKKYFTDKSTQYVIDYKNSTIKDLKLITYLSNLDIPADVSFNGCTEEEVFSFLTAYMNATMLVNLATVENIIIDIIGQVKGIYSLKDKDFIENNKQIIDGWISKIDSLTLYNMYIVGDNSFKEFVTNFEEDKTDSLVGVNFISLIKNPFFSDLLSTVDKTKLKYYSTYFNQYMFKGKSLYSYWAVGENPLFLLTYSISSGNLTSEEYTKAMNNSLEEIKNATPV